MQLVGFGLGYRVGTQPSTRGRLTFNEPGNFCFLGYATGVMAPFLKDAGGAAGWQCSLHVLQARCLNRGPAPLAAPAWPHACQSLVTLLSGGLCRNRPCSRASPPRTRASRGNGRGQACAPSLAGRLLARLTAARGCQAHAEAVARFRRIVPGGKISMALDSARS
jgi:hypothetical protein